MRLLRAPPARRVQREYDDGDGCRACGAPVSLVDEPPELEGAIACPNCGLIDVPTDPEN